MTDAGYSKAHASPSVRAFARQLGVDLAATSVSGISSGAYMAGQFQLAVLADAERTRGIGVLFVPLDELAAVEAFVRRQCGGREPTTTKTIGPIRPETN